MFYQAYEKGVPTYSISSLVVPVSDVRISFGKKEYRSRYDSETTLFPGIIRKINDSNMQLAAELMWLGENKYLLTTIDDKKELTIVKYHKGYEGYVGDKCVFEAKVVDRTESDLMSYKQSEYDLTYMLRLTFKKSMSDKMRMFVCAFPMLRFAYDICQTDELVKNITLDWQSFHAAEGHGGYSVEYIADTRKIKKESYFTSDTGEHRNNVSELDVPDWIKTEDELRDYWRENHL